MLRRLVNLYTLPLLATLILQVVVLQYTAKYLPWPSWVTGVVVFPLSVYGYKCILERPGLVPEGWRVPALYFAAAGTIAAIIYPRADALRSVMRGSDQDDCVRIVVGRLLNGHLDYHDAYSYFGKANPCSTGLGEAVLYAPFVPLGLYAFGSLAYVAACYSTMGPSRSSAERNVFLALLGSTLLSWNSVAVGSDFLLIGAVALLAVLALERVETSRHQRSWLALASILCGLTASSRVAFFYLPAVLALMVIRSRPLASCYFLLSTTIITAAFTLGPYLLSPQEYSPLHVVGKGTRILGPYMAVVVGLLALAGCQVVMLGVSGGIRNGRLMLAIALGTPMAAIAYSEADRGTVTAHYLAVAVPAFCAWLAQYCTSTAITGSARNRNDPTGRTSPSSA